MSEAIEYEQFDQAAPGGAGTPSDADLSRLREIPVELSVEIGRTHMTVGEALDLHVGSVVGLERAAGESADLLVNGTAIARGEVVVIDEQYGLRVTEILDGRREGELSGAGSGTALGDAGAAEETPAEVASADGSNPAEV